jgi:DNA repair protein RecO (recombination protein O)
MSGRERVYRTEAVVLRRFNLGEADRLLTLYTLKHGKVKAIAKGVRRPKSRKAGHLEPFTQVELMLARGRELDIITQAEAIDTYPQLREDLVRIGQASYVIELVDAFTVERDENRLLFGLLITTLDRLAHLESVEATIRHFELRFLELAGFRPEWFVCLNCKDEVRPEDQFFSADQGGVLCARCGAGRKDVRPISLTALKVMRHFHRSNYETAAQVTIRSSVHTELDGLMEDYINYLLERRLNTTQFLRRVKRMPEMGPKPGPTST